MEASSRTAAATQARRDTSLPDGCAGLHPDDDDDGVEERPTETAGWEDAIAVMMVPAESSLRSCTSTASMKVKNIRRLPVTKGHFPTLAECAHFHYEYVDFGSVQLCLTEDENDLTHIDQDPKELVYLVQICCQGRSWMVRRSYEEFRVLDKHLHLCIYDRRFSQLPELPRIDSLKENSETLSQMLTAYISRLSAIADNKINCGPALTWMEIDNKGNHLLVRDESSINVPAVAAAHVVKRYSAQAADELSFEVGDIVSVIDMPPKEDTGWWRGKRGFQVGFFPSDCVELISEKSPSNVTSSLTKPVSRKHGKLITFLRTFMKSRPSKQKLKQRGILRERVFGCDLGEHLLNSGHDVPQVIRSCTEFIERNGVVDGIYRLSGISSNIQKLRHEFDSEHVPDLTKDTYVQDIHSVGSLCKLYFRELPNPLLTYQLYEKFSDAVSAATDDERLVKVHDVIQQLPPPHYRTLEFLMRHLSRMGTYSAITNMHCKNLAIVWAPNLLRSKQIESACFSGTSAFMEVRVQSVVVEFMLNHVDVLFSPKLSTLIRHSTGHTTSARPKSLLVSSPSTKLLSLEEAQARTQAQLVSPVSPDSRYIDVGEGPAALRGKFHTVIDFPAERKKASTKVKRSPVGNWLSFFNVRPKLRRHPSEPNETRTPTLPGGRGDAETLRSAKSEESLSQAFEGGFNLYRPRRPLSTSDALSVSFNEELLNSRMTADSQSSLKDLKKHTISPALMVLAHPAGDVASVNIEPRAFRSTQMTEHTEDDGKKRGSSKSGGSVGENKTLEKVPRPPDLIPMDLDGADPAAPDQLETGTSTDGQLVSTRNLVQKTGAVGRPSDIGPLMNKPTATSNIDEGHRRSASFCKAEGKSANAKEHRRTNSGAVTFECTPGLVRSVSLITPHPAVKNAARLLALELAESAQKASLISKRGSSEPPTPVSPLHHLNQFLSGREEQYIATKIIPGPSSTMSTESHTETGSPRSTCACHGSESGLSFSEGCDAPYYSQSTPHKNSEKLPSLDNHSSVKDNIRHVGVGTERGIHTDGLVKCASVSQPFTESLLKHTSSDGHSAIDSLHDKQATAANFQAMLADAAMPDAFPPPGIAAYQYKAKEQSYLQHASGPDEPNIPYYHQDVPHSRVLLRNYCNSLASRAIHQSMKYRGQRDEFSTAGQRYPPLDGASVYPTIRRVRSMHTPPEDKFCFSQHRGSRNKPFPKLPPSEIQQVRPYFEDGKVRYRYSPHSEAPYNKTDQYRDNTPGYVLSYTLNRLPLQSLKVSDSAENFHKPHHKVSVSKESEFLPRTNSRPLCESLSSSFSEKHYNPSHRRDNSGKSRHLGSLAPQPHFETFTSRSNSGKEMLISTEGADGKYRVTMVSHYSPEHQHPEPDSAVSYRSDRHGRGQRAKSALKLKQSQSMHNYPQHGLDSTAPSRNPTLQKEYSCPDFKHTGSSEGFGLALHSSDKLVRKTHSNSKEDYQYIWAMSREPLRSRRSQSVRTRHSPQPAKRTLERDHRLSFPSQSRTRTRSMYVPSRSDHSESRTGSNVFPKYSCITPHRLFSAALHHAELRPEMQIYGE